MIPLNISNNSLLSNLTFQNNLNKPANDSLGIGSSLNLPTGGLLNDNIIANPFLFPETPHDRLADASDSQLGNFTMPSETNHGNRILELSNYGETVYMETQRAGGESSETDFMIVNVEDENHSTLIEYSDGVLVIPEPLTNPYDYTFHDYNQTNTSLNIDLTGAAYVIDNTNYPALPATDSSTAPRELTFIDVRDENHSTLVEYSDGVLVIPKPFTNFDDNTFHDYNQTNTSLNIDFTGAAYVIDETSTRRLPADESSETDTIMNVWSPMSNKSLVTEYENGATVDPDPSSLDSHVTTYDYNQTNTSLTGIDYTHATTIQDLTHTTLPVENTLDWTDSAWWIAPVPPIDDFFNSLSEHW